MVYKLKWLASECTGCQACMVACMDEHDLDPDYGEMSFCRIAESAGVSWRMTICLQCETPACVTACEKEALWKDTVSGQVLCDSDRCVGCGNCVEACPQGAVSLDRHGKAGKCDGCIGRVQAGLLPACVRACRSGAIMVCEVYK